MSRAAIYQLFRRIPDADDAAIDAAVDALKEPKADVAELRAEMRAGFTLVHWMIGILTAFMTALHMGTLWMLFGLQREMVERFSALEAAVRALGG